MGATSAGESVGRLFLPTLLQSVQITAIAGAVAAVAAAVFTGQMFAAIGYALFASCALWSLLTGSANLAQIRKLEGDLSGKEKEIQALTSQIRESAEQVSAAAEMFGENNGNVQEGIKKLKEENESLKKKEVTWNQEKALFTEQLGRMTTQNRDLSVAVSMIKRNLTDLKTQVQTLSGNTAIMDQSLASVAQAEEAIENKETALSAMRQEYDDTFDEDFKQLSLLIEKFIKAKTELEKLVGQGSVQSTVTVNDIESRMAALTEREKQLEDREQKVKLQQIAVLKAADEIRNKEKATRDQLSIEIERLKDQLAKQQKKLQEALGPIKA